MNNIENNRLSISFIESNNVVTEETVSEVDTVDDGMTDATAHIIPENTKRTCRHMGITESSPSCDICKLVSFSTFIFF